MNAAASAHPGHPWCLDSTLLLYAYSKIVCSQEVAVILAKMPQLSQPAPPPGIPPGIAPQRRPVAKPNAAGSDFTEVRGRQPKVNEGRNLARFLHKAAVSQAVIAIMLIWTLQIQARPQCHQMTTSAAEFVMATVRHPRYARKDPVCFVTVRAPNDGIPGNYQCLQACQLQLTSMSGHVVTMRCVAG